MSDEAAESVDIVSELDEIINTLKRSNSPTLIVEGSDDYVAFNEFEINNVAWGFTILPVKGVDNVRKIIDRADEIAHPALAFLVDRDCSVFPHVAPPYNRADTFYTDGYSIENDLLRDGNVEKLLKPSERPLFSKELAMLLSFFTCAAACHLSAAPGYALSTKPDRIFDRSGHYQPEFDEWVKAQQPGLAPEFNATAYDPLKFIQGKSLLSLFTRHLSHSTRSSKFSGANLLEIGAVERGPFMTRIENDVLTYFRSIGLAPV